MLQPCYSLNKIEAGADEVGRGCIAGPVVAAAVIMPKRLQHPLLKDSKLLNAAQRKNMRNFILRHALAYAVSAVPERIIDEINIAQASYKAIHQSIDDLIIQPELLLIDGKWFKPYRNIPHRCVIKGDNRYTAIAAAAILAKTWRDELMRQKGEEYPAYGWQRNVGYPTRQHKEAVARYGPTPLHRRSFRW